VRPNRRVVAADLRLTLDVYSRLCRYDEAADDMAPRSTALPQRAEPCLVAYQLSPVKARGGMFEQLCAELPWSQRLSAVWRLHDPEERDASLALRSAHGNRVRHAVGWYRTHDRLHTGDPIAMATDALTAYETARTAGKDSLLVCDTWEMADALNRRVHDTHTATTGPAVKAARDQDVSVGDLIMSRTNDATIALRPAPNRAAAGQPDQVRNGNRWRVAAVDPGRNRLAAERLTDGARVVFDGDYLRENITLGYAATVHAAQGVTADASYAILGEHASRAMAYVAMTRGHQRGIHLPTRHRRSRPPTHPTRHGTQDPHPAPRQYLQRRPPPPTNPRPRRPAGHHARSSRTHTAPPTPRHDRRTVAPQRTAPRHPRHDVARTHPARTIVPKRI
jgi:hypothetical protein